MAASRPGRQHSKSERIAVQRETIAYLERLRRKFNSVIVKYENREPKFERVGACPTLVQVSPLDTLDAVAELQLERKVGFLVMANATNPGGGYLRGTNGQEEAICRRTNLPLLFESMAYPIPEYGSFYVHGAHVLRASESVGYEFLDPAIRADCVLAAAYHDPPTTADGKRLCDGYRERMALKIDSILSAFAANDCSAIVLGAWGCGAFGNPEDDIAALFAEALQGRFAGVFDRVVFAVLREAGARNFRAFSSCFGDASLRPGLR